MLLHTERMTTLPDTGTKWHVNANSLHQYVHQSNGSLQERKRFRWMCDLFLIFNVMNEWMKLGDCVRYHDSLSQKRCTLREQTWAGDEFTTTSMEGQRCDDIITRCKPFVCHRSYSPDAVDAFQPTDNDACNGAAQLRDALSLPLTRILSAALSPIPQDNTE